MRGDTFKGKLLSIEQDLGESGCAWFAEGFEQLDHFLRLRAEWEQYCYEQGIEP